MKPNYKAMVLSCIDPRFQPIIYNYLKKKKLKGKYSSFTIAGSAIGVTANVAAKLASDFQKACVDDIKRAAELDILLQPLHSSLFIESNPSPVKYAASLLGMCKPTVRLPLVEVRDETKKKISEALKVAKLL